MYKALIISTCKAYGLLRNQAAYVLATADHETNGTFMPVREAYWVKNAEQWRKRNLRYYPWYGRGFVQLTWEGNYIKAGQKIGVDLTKDPDAAMQPDHAAKILVQGMKEGWFTGKKLSDYITLQASEFVSARRIINGTDKDDEIAAIAIKYDAELRKAGYGVEAPKPIPPTSASPKRKTLVDLLKGWFVQKAVNHVAHQLKDTPLMNSNLIHNLLNVAIALVAILSLPEVVAILPPEMGVVVAGVLAALKTVINIARDGFGGLFKEQPPVR